MNHNVLTCYVTYFMIGFILGALVVKVGPDKNETVTPWQAVATVLGLTALWPLLFGYCFISLFVDWLIKPDWRDLK